MAKRRRINRRKQIRNISVLVLICLLVLFLFISNFTRIRLWSKGYSWNQQNIVLKLDKESIKEYLKLDRLIDVEAWQALENDHHYLEYELYQDGTKSSKEQTVEYIDALNYLKQDLLTLGYPVDQIHTYMMRYSIKDFEEIVDKQYEYKKVKEYLDLKGCQVRDIQNYEDGDEFGLKAIMSTSYSNIDSSKPMLHEYLLEDPSNILAFVKKGYYVDAEYVPHDLVSTGLEVSNEFVSNKLRKEAAISLDKMAKAASKKGYELMINSAYRSYEDQQAVYDEYFSIYDPVTAASLVAIPGSSEHQLGLSVDLTSRSVFDGKCGVFGESPEYRWVVKHAHEYGFILRYPENKTSITGTANEPWHFRYVGKKIAQEIKEKKTTFEEYLLEKGFPYDLKIKE